MDGKTPHKTCFKCDRLLPLTEFYTHPQMADGHVNKCKECNKRDVKKHYQDTFEQRQAYEKTRANLPHRIALNRVVVKRMRENFPRKYKARAAVNNAIRTGLIQRQSCERCGSLRTHAHHEDYSKPLDVMWLCPLHHKARHRELEDMGITL